MPRLDRYTRPGQTIQRQLNRTSDCSDRSRLKPCFDIYTYYGGMLVCAVVARRRPGLLTERNKRNTVVIAA
eukprot:scaffold680934_cov66-Prasinocladus_malaysianus.AAC.1